MARRPKLPAELDVELANLPEDLRWRTFMGRIEAILFAAPAPVTREALARVIGRGCSLDALIADLRAELRRRPCTAHENAFRRGDPGRHGAGRPAAGPLPGRVPGPRRDRLLPADHPRRTRAVFRPGSEPRHDRASARARVHRLRPPQPATGSALYLRDDENVPGAFRVRHAARPARHRGPRRRGAPQQGQAARRGLSAELYGRA